MERSHVGQNGPHRWGLHLVGNNGRTVWCMHTGDSPCGRTEGMHGWGTKKGFSDWAQELKYGRLFQMEGWKGFLSVGCRKLGGR